MITTSRFRPNAPDIAHQVIDGEVVIVDLRRGNYFSLQGTACVIWECLEQGASLEETTAELASRYDHPPDLVHAEVLRLVSELRENEIIRSDDSAQPQPLAPPACEPKLPFEAPVLQKFTDMRDLILLDPIHEVDEGGWPNPREAA